MKETGAPDQPAWAGVGQLLGKLVDFNELQDLLIKVGKAKPEANSEGR